MVLGAMLGAGIGIIGGISLGTFLFSKRQPRDFAFLDVEMETGSMRDRRANAPSGPVPKDLREALEFTPMWTRWPDYERVAWVNYAIKVLWPHYNKAITEMVAKEMVPHLSKAVQQVGVLEALEIECLDLGNRPIRIGGIKVYETNEDEVILEAPILWGSNAKIRLSARLRLGPAMMYVPVEVSDIVMKAESRITIKPLVETLPCLGAVTISLLKEPFVDLSVMVINRLDLMALPILRVVAQKIVKDTVGDMLVFPNQMSFDIMPNGGRPPEPEGMLTVTVLKANGLKSSGDLFSKSDPFVVVEVRDGRPVQSAAVANNTDPEFHETFHLVVDSTKTQFLTLSVKDEDFGWQDKTMGAVRIPLESMPFVENPLETYELELNLFKTAGVPKPKNEQTVNPNEKDPPRPIKMSVKKMRKHIPDSNVWEDVPFEGEAACPEHLEDPASKAAKDKKEKKDKNHRGTVTVHVTMFPFNREAMAAGHEAENQSVQRPDTNPRSSITRRMDQSRLQVARGVLTVTLTRCLNLQGDGTSDPQVTISLFDQQAEITKMQYPLVQKSSVVYNEQSPRWGDKFDFVGISADSFIVFNVKDISQKDKNGDKKSLGKLRIPVPDVVRNLRIKDVWALQETQQGEIALTLEWKSLAFREAPEDVLEGN
mmetsp:Transcript_21148/g.58683  ORF Transcript_21148/g.58683 Transcript_21148/m.58683 type:complete len:654 (+) Transcript_21148:121-2082(+)